MGLLHQVWKRLTHTKSLDLSSGSYETLFFESVYRVTYFSGFSLSDRNLPYVIYSNILKLLIMLLISCEFWFFVSIPWDLDQVIDSVNITIIQFSAIYKYKNLMDHKDIFKNLASTMESPYLFLTTPERRKLVEFWRKRNETCLSLLLGLGTGTLAVWYTYPLIDDLEYNLMIAIRLPFEYHTPPRYALAYTSVLIVFSYISYFVMINDLIMQAHVMHLLCQFSVLNDCFRNMLTDCCEDNEELKLLNQNFLFMSDTYKQKYVKKFDDLIKQHQWILNNVLALRTILSRPMLAQLATSTTLICSIGYQVATSTEDNTKRLRSIMYLGYNLSVLYIICRWCEEVTAQSANIGVAVYCSGWERGAAAVRGVRARVLLVMARARKPLVFSAGGMYDVSLASYANMIKTSYSALTVLLRLR